MAKVLKNTREIRLKCHFQPGLLSIMLCDIIIKSAALGENSLFCPEIIVLNGKGRSAFGHWPLPGNIF